MSDDTSGTGRGPRAAPVATLGERPAIGDVLRKAIEWHFAPTIRVEEAGTAAHGAIREGIDKRRGRPLGVYTEITGYAVSLFTFMQRAADDSRFHLAAREAGDYLIRIQSEDGAYPHTPDPADRIAAEHLFAFDTAVCIVGMARLARAAHEEKYLRSAAAAGQWLMRMQRPDGGFSAMTVQNEGQRDHGGFFGDGSCVHAKNAIALLELHAMTNREDHRRAAIKACDRVLRLQDEDGAFWSTPDKRYVFTHAHCYACEGLLYAGKVLGEIRFLDAARRGIEWLARRQQPCGGWMSHYKTSLTSPRRLLEKLWRPMPSDAAAQAARLFRLGGNGYESNRRSALQFLARCQDAAGGFYYRRSRLGNCPLMYTWSAQFAVQALAWDSTPAAVEDLF